MVLNATYEPLCFVSARRAVCLVLKEKAQIIEGDNERAFRAEKIIVPFPRVVRLLAFVEVPRWAKRHVSRTLLFARDRYTCQYCGRHYSEFKKGECLTIEHVKPKSRGGLTEWENVVTACNACNARKADKLPMEAKMYPINTPREPRYIAIVFLANADDVQKRWLEYWIR
ncbi:MAG: HNH endonuclease [Actinobacteria bacterium]|nr:HNH endonuclease [Actinomycetota bacterium]